MDIFHRMNLDSIVLASGKTTRRSEIPFRPEHKLNIVELVKNSIGKSVDDIPIPFNYREPLSMLQRLTEEMFYSESLDKAARCDDVYLQMAHVAAYAISCYSNSIRTTKPFNPMIGETYECDRTNDVDCGGWRSLCEQISYNPSVIAVHADSKHGWEFNYNFKMTSKFRLNYLQVVPTTVKYLKFRNTGQHYTWNIVPTYVRNILVGKFWVENIGDVTICNHEQQIKCNLKFLAHTYFSPKSLNTVNGYVSGPDENIHYLISGTWTEKIELFKVDNPGPIACKDGFVTSTPIVIWEKKPDP